MKMFAFSTVGEMSSLGFILYIQVNCVLNAKPPIQLQ